MAYSAIFKLALLGVDGYRLGPRRELGDLSYFSPFKINNPTFKKNQINEIKLQH